MRSKFLTAVVGFFIVLGFLTPQTMAQNTLFDKANSPDYKTKAGPMLGRGLLNATTCFVDIIVQTVERSKDGPPVVGTLAGIGGGAACTVLRAGSGVVDVATFWIPGFNGVPVSPSYSNCLDFDTQETYEAPMQMQQTPQPYVSQATPVSAPAQHDPMKYVKK